MKKVFIAAAAGLMLVGSACNRTATPEDPKTAADSLAVAYGVFDGSQWMQNLQMSAMQGRPIDSMAFMKGYEDGLNDTTKFAYLVGAISGAQRRMSMQEDTVDLGKFLASFRAALFADSANIKMKMDDARAFVQAYQEKKQERELRKQYGKNIDAGNEFIAKYKSENKDAKQTASGLVYRVISEGQGVATPQDGQTVKVKYVGKTVDGNEFDKNDEGTEFNVNQVIPGWTEMLKLMKKGQKVECVIPQELAYGPRGSYSIEPFSTLIFTVELLDIKNEE
ncbi:MAG: FKBP-type peptidyl-prolyl cis-trans isomerase [Porphyromonas sp.]|nr:FKBP-type peptidyl-prolyl cis-trans isomerase [Porphyromonas sp.]